MITYHAVAASVLKKHLPGVYINYGDDTIQVGEHKLMRLGTDCGSLVIYPLYGATEQSLAHVRKFCLLSGYSRVVGTLVNEDPTYSKDKETLKKAGYKVVQQGRSHRNPFKRSCVVTLSIPEKEFTVKGYQKVQE